MQKKTTTEYSMKNKVENKQINFFLTKGWIGHFVLLLRYQYKHKLILIQAMQQRVIKETYTCIYVHVSYFKLPQI